VCPLLSFRLGDSSRHVAVRRKDSLEKLHPKSWAVLVTIPLPIVLAWSCVSELCYRLSAVYSTVARIPLMPDSK
jgi:hypothetical protein